MTEQTSRTQDSSRGRRWRQGKLGPIVSALIALLVLALIQTFFVKVYRIPSESMEPLLFPGDRILVNRTTADSVQRGDVVVFEHGADWSDAQLPPSPSALTNLARTIGSIIQIGPSNKAFTVKRVIGVGGDTVSCCDAEGRIVVNGAPVTDPQLGSNYDFQPGVEDCSTTPRSLRCFPEVTLPDHRLLVMGDNRAHSADSVIACRGASQDASCVRTIADSQVVGQVFATIWPPGRWGGH